MLPRGLGGFGVGLTLHNDVCLPYFLEYCNEEQKQRWLPGIADGTLITAIGMTEPGTGSDLAGIKTKAVRDGDHYIVNGAKTFITNGINGDLIVTAVKTDPSERHKGISMLVIEGDAPGLERGRNLEKVGMHSQDTAELFFNDARVPVENLLGRRGPGLRPDGPQPRPGAPQRRGGRRRERAGRDPLDGRVRQGAPGVRPADRQLPEHPLPARRVPHRGRRRAGVPRPVHDGARPGHADASSAPRR